MKISNKNVLILLAFMSLMLNAMDNKPQAGPGNQMQMTLMDKNQRGQASGAEALTLQQLTPAQRDLIEQMLTFKKTHRVEQSTIYTVPVVTVALSLGIPGIAFLILWLLDHNQKACLLGGISGTVGAAILASMVAVAWINFAYDKAHVNRAYQRHVNDGLETGIASISDPILELLNNELKASCYSTCRRCLAIRKDCTQCSELAHELIPFDERHRQKICDICWNTACSNCPRCKVLREKAICHSLVTQLGLKIDHNDADIDSFRTYVQTLVNRQCTDAHISV